MSKSQAVVLHVPPLALTTLKTVQDVQEADGLFAAFQSWARKHQVETPTWNESVRRRALVQRHGGLLLEPLLAKGFKQKGDGVIATGGDNGSTAFADGQFHLALLLV